MEIGGACSGPQTHDENAGSLLGDPSNGPDLATLLKGSLIKEFTRGEDLFLGSQDYRNRLRKDPSILLLLMIIEVIRSGD
jgi:hypothetical protein